MKKLTSVICMTLAIAASSTVMAQMPKDQMDKGMMKDGPMTVSGCVAAAPSAGGYMLNNAMMMSGGMMNKEMMDKDKMKPGMSGDMTMSYELVGGELKPHVGHKVEVTGTMSKMDMDNMDKMGKMDKMGRDKMMADKTMKPMKLQVTAVKMISATCP